jgi:peptide/nickel transport system substrate-binding protein
MSPNRRSVFIKRLGIFPFLFALTLLACSASPPEEPAKAQANSYEVDVIRLEGGDWGYPSPFAHYPRGPGGFKMCLIFDSLLERDEKGLIPWLAENYSISEDGKTYRFTIRKGVKWQDGHPLTAADAAFSLTYANRHAATWSYIFDTLEEVSTEGEDTVVVRLKRPHAAMLYNLGRTRIIPEHIWASIKRPKEFTAPEAVIGCGPYRLTAYSKEHGTYRFEAFEGYWGPRQRVGVIEFVPVSEPILAYEKGEIDLIGVSPDILPRFEAKEEHRIVRSPAFWGYRLLFNMEKVSCLQDLSLRQALAHAIDRQELVAKIARGAAVPGSMGILPPDHVMAADEVRTYPFDPEKTRALLDAAGYDRTGADGVRLSPDGNPLALRLLCSSREVRMAELIAQRLKEVGMRISVVSVDAKTRDTRVRGSEYELAILGHGGWGSDPDYLAARFAGHILDQNAAPSHSGLRGFDAPHLMELLRRQQTQIDPEQRKTLIIQIQKELAELLPEMPLYYTTGYSVFRPATYDGWIFMYDHHSLSHSKLSYLSRTGAAQKR